MIEIELYKIKKVLELILSEIIKLESNNKNIILNKDLYWNILESEIYNVYEEPRNMTIGSLIDDWQYIETLLKLKEDDIQIINYDLHKILSIVKFIYNKNILL